MAQLAAEHADAIASPTLLIAGGRGRFHDLAILERPPR
jgi:hypothetical protein